jgi:histidinol-phosphate aminotransferase
LCRLGIAIAQPPLIQILTNTKAPYNVSLPTALLGLSALSPIAISSMRTKVATLTLSRVALLRSLVALAPLGLGKAIGGNDANFVLVPVLAKDGGGNPDNERSQRVYKAMAEESGVVVRFRGRERGCEGCLRITVGTEEENKTLITKLSEILSRL